MAGHAWSDMCGDCGMSRFNKGTHRVLFENVFWKYGKGLQLETFQQVYFSIFISCSLLLLIEYVIQIRQLLSQEICPVGECLCNSQCQTKTSHGIPVAGHSKVVYNSRFYIETVLKLLVVSHFPQSGLARKPQREASSWST